MLQLEWRRLRLPLSEPLKIGRKTLKDRVVLELRLGGGGGPPGLGEAAPLPGLHAELVDHLPELLPKALAALREAVGVDPARLAGPTAFPRLLMRLHGGAAWPVLPPSLRCGLESAVLAWMSGGLDPSQRIGLPSGDAPPTSALFDGRLEDLLEAFDGPLAGARCVKLKVGRRDLESELRLVRGLRHALGPEGEIRLDANRAFGLQEALEFAEGVRPCAPVWIEEPLRSPLALPDFLERAGLAVAVDETLLERDHAHLAYADGVVAWVLKPSLLGLRETLEHFRRALAHPARPVCVVSSCFEGFTGLGLLRSLARCAPGRPAPGLGTARWLSGFDEPLDAWTRVRG